MDGYMGGWVDGWMDGWISGWWEGGGGPRRDAVFVDSLTA